MCGIIGYTGTKNAAPILLGGLLDLKYRGYDSAGIAVSNDCGLECWRVEGRPENLEGMLAKKILTGNAGIGHNRWATHGKPSKQNAHPHLSRDRCVAVVHNGTIENFAALRMELEADGYPFASETDTEVIPHLVERELYLGAGTLGEAVQKAVSRMEGAYGIAVMSSRFPGEIVAAALHSPIVIGLGNGELLVASDEVALCRHVDSVLRMGDGEIITLRKDGSYTPHGPSAEELARRVERVSVSAADASKGGFEHMMLKEIYEQPFALQRTLSGRLHDRQHFVALEGLPSSIERRLADSRRIVITACGTSLYAGMAGKLLIERLARMPVEVEYASEFQYGDPVVDQEDAVIGISQSGETADTIRAVKLAKEKGALCLGITNRIGTSLPKLTDARIFLQAGPEHAVASTKAFTAQVVVLALIAIRMAVARGIPRTKIARFVEDIANVPALVEEVLKTERQVAAIAEAYKQTKRAIFIGRRFGMPLALEGALKLKEIAYVDAMGYPAGELKHGPLALVEDGVPVFAIVRRDGLEEKMLSNMEEVRSRGGHLIALTTKGDERPHPLSRHVIELPDACEELTPVVCAPVFQLLAYHMGVLRGVNVDEPRNLAKSVTVE